MDIKEDLEKKIKFLEARLKSDSERLKRFKDDLQKKDSNYLKEKISLDECEEIL